MTKKEYYEKMIAQNGLTTEIVQELLRDIFAQAGSAMEDSDHRLEFTRDGIVLHYEVADYCRNCYMGHVPATDTCTIEDILWSIDEIEEAR